MQIIYRIESKNFPERFYIGRTHKLKQRVWKHNTALNHNRHHSIKLQRHFNKYGKNDLVYSIVEECDDGKVLEREQYWIDTLNPYFNCYKSSLGREKGSKPWNFGIKTNVVPWNKGKKMNEKQRLDLVGHVVSEETKLKIGNSKKGIAQPREVADRRNRSNYKPIEQYSLDNKLLNIFDSIKNASLINNIGYNSIASCCRGIQKTGGGFIWKFVERNK